MLNIKELLINKLNLFNEQEFLDIEQKSSITSDVNQETKEICFIFTFFSEPSVEELIKLWEFKHEVIHIKIELLFLYGTRTLLNLISKFCAIKGLFINEIEGFLVPSSLCFSFPEIIWRSMSLEGFTFFEKLSESIHPFLKFVFGNKQIFLITKKSYQFSSKHKKNKFLLFHKENLLNYNKNIRSCAYGFTNFQEEILLLHKIEREDIENIDELEEDSWYEITYTLDDPENKRLKNYDGWITSSKLIKTPLEYIKEDIATQKINCLSLHTKFSSFDGLYNYEDFAKLAKKYNHTALGVTDFSSVQSFPQTERAAKSTGIKPIYGCEFEVFSKNLSAAINLENLLSDDFSFCLFDIETTGLNPLLDEITEIAIIKYKNGIFVENFSAYCKISRTLKPEIVELTKITDELLLEKGENPAKVLKNISEFVKDSVLIAHNGISFDLPFLNAQYKKHGLPPLKNPLLDTLFLAKALYGKDKHKSYALGALAKKFLTNFNAEEAHSAFYDTKILAELWEKMSGDLMAEGIDINKQLKDINNLLDRESFKKNLFGHNILIYAKNQQGIKDLYKLVSLAHTTWFNEKPMVEEESLSEYRKNLFIVSSAFNSILIELVLKNDEDMFEKKIQLFDYVLLPPPSIFLLEHAKNNFDENEGKQVLEILYQWCKKYNKKIIFNYCAKYLYPEDIEKYKVLVHAKSIGGKRHALFSYKPLKNDLLPDFSFRKTVDLIGEYKFLNIPAEEWYLCAYSNHEELINNVDNDICIVQQKLHAPIIDGCEENIKKIIAQTIKEKYGEKTDDYLNQIIERELNLIIENNFGVVYWVSHLLVKKSIKDGYLVGSRGSVGSSFIAFLLNISDVNPLKPHYFCTECSYLELHEDFLESGFDLPDKKCEKCQKDLKKDGQNIPFETFLGLDGNKVPDIDLNFSGEYQLKAHNFLRDIFGRNNTFRSGTISTIAKKTAYALTLTYLEDKKINYTLGKIARLSQQIIDVKRTTGQHPGGILIIPSNKEIYDFSPINYPANDTTSDWLTTHLEFHDLHDTLFKFDILGHDDPTFLAMLHKITGFAPQQINYQDANILKMFSSIEPLKISPSSVMDETVGTIGLPEFGTMLTRKILRNCEINTFADLIRISGISHGTNVWKNNIDNLVKGKKRQLNQVITCRDDVMIYLHSCGLDIKDSFAITESVRKGKGIPEKYLSLLKAKRVPQWYIESANKISYIFPKAHATAYVLMSWKIAFYKLYYPLEFYATYFSIHRDFFDLELFITNDAKKIEEKYKKISNEIKEKNKKFSINNKTKFLLMLYEVALEMLARNIKFANIDMNKSHALNFLPIKENNSILIPFISIDGLGVIVAHQIEKNRQEQGDFIDSDDVAKRTKINSTVLKTLENLKIIQKQSNNAQMRIEDFQ